ncbi:MAG: hypothetical protein HY291_19940 [Planctomycetes bacterium]|nr:hypothetical protein [Planctomycetota bacterium]
MDLTPRKAIEAEIENGLRSGKDPKELMAALIEKGWPVEDARIMVARGYEILHPGEIASVEKKIVRSAGVGTMKVGALVAALGLGLTGLSYFHAQWYQSSMFIYFPGLILCGFFVFLGGLYQWVFGRRLD